MACEQECERVIVTDYDAIMFIDQWGAPTNAASSSACQPVCQSCMVARNQRRVAQLKKDIAAEERQLAVVCAEESCARHARVNLEYTLHEKKRHLKRLTSLLLKAPSLL